MERDKLLGTMDAKVWTDEFMATKARLGDEEFDHAMMLAWFANAIMAGFDEANRCAQRALDAEREKVKAEQEQWEIQAREGGRLKDQLTQLQAQLRQAEGERDAFTRKYHEAMGILSAWRNIDHADAVARLLKAETDLTTLRQLVAALPVVDVQEVSVWLSPDESGWLVSKRPAFPAGLYWAKFRTQAEADSFRALLAYRATLVAQDAPLTDEQRAIRDCCEKPHDCKWGGLGGCGYEGRKYELKQDAAKENTNGL